AHAESVYLSGRNIGDEYRYVLDRRYQKKYPGNLLERPALLLNPWVLRSTDTGEQAVRAGDDFAPKGEPAPSSPAEDRSKMLKEGGGANFEGRMSADLDFLADASAVITNRVPENGVVKINRKEIGPHAMIHVVAVDPLSTTSRSTTLAEQPAK